MSRAYSKKPGTPDEVLLGERIRTGDRAAENALVGLYSDRVFCTAMMHMRDREAASELVDDVMMAAIMALRRGSVHDVACLGAFIHATTVHLVNSRLRARYRMPLSMPIRDEYAGPDLEKSLERDSDLQALRLCFRQLPAHDRLILSMSLIDGLRPCEIARVVGLSAEVVRQQKCRALKQLRRLLEALPGQGIHAPQSHRKMH